MVRNGFYRAAAASVMLVLLGALAAPAVEITGQSRTFLHSRESFSRTDLMPIYEYLDIRAEELGRKELSFHFGGWLRYDLRDDSSGSDRNSDLQYAYLAYRAQKANGTIQLGRMPVSEGTATGLIDGIYARTDLRGGFTVAAMGGSPVEIDRDGSSGDSMYGGRLAHSFAGFSTLGLSYIKERNAARPFREEEGVDLWIRPVSLFEIVGRSSYNAITDAWREHTYTLLLAPIGAFQLSADGSRISYGDYFASSTTPAFRFDPAVIDPKETVKTVGGTATYTAGSSGVSISADYRSFNYKIAGDADRSGGAVSYAGKGGLSIGAAAHRMNGATDRLRYDEYRAYAGTSAGKLRMGLDLLLVSYDAAVNGIKNAKTAVVYGAYPLGERTRLAADLEYGRNPYYDKDLRAMVKLVHDLAFSSAKAAEPKPKRGR